MKEKQRTFLLNLLTGFVIAAAVFALNMSREYGAARSVCDGFFVAAVLLLGIGGIRGVRNKGAFDVTGYGIKTALETALPILRHDGKKETMDEYRQRKASERKGARSLLLAGAVYFVLSLIAYLVYRAV